MTTGCHKDNALSTHLRSGRRKHLVPPTPDSRRNSGRQTPIYTLVFSVKGQTLHVCSSTAAWSNKYNIFSKEGELRGCGKEKAQHVKDSEKHYFGQNPCWFNGVKNVSDFSTSSLWQNNKTLLRVCYHWQLPSSLRTSNSKGSIAQDCMSPWPQRCARICDPAEIRSEPDQQ